MNLAEKIDYLVNRILLKAENQHELLIGDCQSDVQLTNTQEHILMLLANENLTNTDLAKRLNLTQAAMTKAVKSLIKQGMLEATKDKVDARQTRFQLTDKAVPVATEHEHHHKATMTVYSDLLKSFKADEKVVIERFLNEIVKELEE